MTGHPRGSPSLLPQERLTEWPHPVRVHLFAPTSLLTGLCAQFRKSQRLSGVAIGATPERRCCLNRLRYNALLRISHRSGDAQGTTGATTASRRDRVCRPSREARHRRTSRNPNDSERKITEWESGCESTRREIDAKGASRDREEGGQRTVGIAPLFAMKRPSRTMNPLPTPPDQNALADRAVYAGSVEHKDRRSWLGLPHPRRNPRADLEDHRQNATICPLVSDTDRETATRWVQHAIRSGQFDPTICAYGFPRHIWHRDNNGQYWHGRLTKAGGDNAPAEYKGWPISEREWHENFH